MTTRTKPSDFTGAQRQRAAKDAEQELAKRQGDMAMTQQIALDREDTDVFDPATSESLGAYESVKIDPEKKEVVIRVVEDIEDMTFGAGTSYTFRVGQKYKVSEDLADHLDSIGYLLGRV